MTIVDRKTLTVFGIYAMEGINEIYPRPSDSSIHSAMQSSGSSETIYTLQGIRISGEPTMKGVYIINGKKHLK